MIVDDTFERQIWNIDKFDGNFYGLFCFCCVNLWIIVFSLLVPWRFLDEYLRKPWRYSDVFNAKVNDHNCFYWLDLPKHWCFIAARRWSLMTLWRDIIETMTILMETFLIFIVFVVLNSEPLMFHCFFILDSLMTHWRRIDDSSI